MVPDHLERLLVALTETYGTDAVKLRAPVTNENGAYFSLEGVPATFSVHTQDGALPDGELDIQIESVPPGEYIYADVVSLDDFLRLVARVAGPKDQWPVPLT